MPTTPPLADSSDPAGLAAAADLFCRCPGDGMLISPSIHLGRLAAFYPPCVHCEHRAGPLNASRSGDESCAAAAPAASGLFAEEGLEGIVDNQIHARVVRQLALAAGVEFLRAAGAAPRVVLGADGRAVTAELLAAASEGLLRCGCHLVEIEPTTSPGVAEAMIDLDAEGGFFLGNPRGASHTVGVRLWSRGAAPMSSGGRLDSLERQFETHIARPTRASGSLQRHCGGEARQQRFRELFHALRPLRFVLDTASKPLAAEAQRLLAPTACQAITPRWLSQDPPPSRGATDEKEEGPAAPARSLEKHRRRLASLAAFTVTERADFGLWIDGDGERLAVMDERGQAVPSERLLLALAGQDLAADAGAAIVIEQEFDVRLRAAFAKRGIALCVAPARREPFALAMAAAGAALGGGPSGRLWFARPGIAPPIPDALAGLGRLLRLLSRRDAPLSQVLGGE